MQKWVSFFSIVISCLGLLITAVPSAHAYISTDPTSNAGPFGLGIQLGGPSGITGKYWLNHNAALQGLIAFNVDDYFLYSMDYVYHYPGAMNLGDSFTSRLIPYFGVGGVIVVTNQSRSHDYEYFGRHAGDFGLGVRIPLGIEWRPAHPSIGVYAELAPGVAIVPETTGFIEGGIGIRYFF